MGHVLKLVQKKGEVQKHPDSTWSNPFNPLFRFNGLIWPYGLLLQKHQKHRCQEIQKYRNVVEVKGAQHP